MNIATALRAYLAALDAHDDGGEAIERLDDVREALAAHDAAVSAGGWRVLDDGTTIVRADFPQSGVVADVNGWTGEPLADRIAACVNAMDGVPDPWELRATLRNVIATARHTGEPVDPEALARALWGAA